MDKKKVFVIMPFQDVYFEVYEILKMHFSDSFEFSNAGEEGNQQNILKDIIQPIFEADVIIADLTGLNPNVMYELGLAHAFNKKTIMITQDDLSQLPFDLKMYRTKDYNMNYKKFNELIEYLKINIFGAIDNSVIFGNPVKDFLDFSGVKVDSFFRRNESIELSNDADKGFLDFLADIEANAEKLTENINDMTSDLNEMNEGILNSSTEINRVKQKGGGGTASFIRKETKKAAKYVEVFSSKLRLHNKNMSELWDEIERNTIGLLENQFSSLSENREGLILYFKNLYNLKKTASENAISIKDMKDAMQSIVGIERSMNQAVRFANEDLSTYTDFIERLCASIDKILIKAKFVVGDIEFEE